MSPVDSMRCTELRRDGHRANGLLVALVSDVEHGIALLARAL